MGDGAIWAETTSGEGSTTGVDGRGFLGLAEPQRLLTVRQSCGMIWVFP